jgi:beta-galactosidase
MQFHRLLLTGLTFLLPAVSLFAQSRQIRDLDFNWKFKNGDFPGAETPSFNDKDWRSLDVPHDWSVESEFLEDTPHGQSIGYLPTGTGWYRKSFNLTKKDLSQKMWIEFDGIYMNSDVWLNGKHLGHYPNGYNSFQYPINAFAKEGTNLLVVKADNSVQPNSRWYSGSGIYRHVRLVVTGQVHLEPFSGIYITTPEILKEQAQVDVKINLRNNLVSERTGSLVSIIIDKNGKEIARQEKPFTAAANSLTSFSRVVTIPEPSLWSPEFPYLYTLVTQVYDQGVKVDETATRFGIRSTLFSAEQGFLLNGKQVKMKGVNLHHDGGSVGAAVPEAVWIRRLKLLKEMGCNAIRTAHNPVAPEFLDMCDSMGFLVMNEVFDEWAIGKKDHSYFKYFPEWGETDLIRFIQRDRNHPSVVMWSVGNEIPEESERDGHLVLISLMDIIRKEDTTRPITAGVSRMDAPDGATTLQYLQALDIVGYNYVDRYKHRREMLFTYDKLNHPDWKMVGSENSSVYCVRGQYSLGNDPGVVAPDYNTLMIDHAQIWKHIFTHDFVMGDFMWTGIDYLGEARWPMITPPTGTMDRCGFPKDSYYFYKSIWTEDPFVHIFPHWNWPGREGQVIPVIAYSNCDAVELFVNGKSFGEQRSGFPRPGITICCNWSRYNPKDQITTSDFHRVWTVPYEPGIITAVGKNDGKVVFTKEIKTTGKPEIIKLSSDKNLLKCNVRDIAHIKVEVLDNDGNVVPYADNLITFKVEGQGKLIAVDNGNPTDHNSFKSNKRNAFHGLCQALVQTTGKEGTIKISASAENLSVASIELKTEK